MAEANPTQVSPTVDRAAAPTSHAASVPGSARSATTVASSNPAAPILAPKTILADAAAPIVISSATAPLPMAAKGADGATERQRDAQLFLRRLTPEERAKRRFWRTIIVSMLGLTILLITMAFLLQLK